MKGAGRCELHETRTGSLRPDRLEGDVRFRRRSLNFACAGELAALAFWHPPAAFVVRRFGAWRAQEKTHPFRGSGSRCRLALPEPLRDQRAVPFGPDQFPWPGSPIPASKRGSRRDHASLHDGADGAEASRAGQRARTGPSTHRQPIHDQSSVKVLRHLGEGFREEGPSCLSRGATDGWSRSKTRKSKSAGRTASERLGGAARSLRSPRAS